MNDSQHLKAVDIGGKELKTNSKVVSYLVSTVNMRNPGSSYVLGVVSYTCSMLGSGPYDPITPDCSSTLLRRAVSFVQVENLVIYRSVLLHHRVDHRFLSNISSLNSAAFLQNARAHSA